MASRMPSNTSAPSASRMASVVIRWPTFLTSSRARPGRVNGWPDGSVYARSGSRRRSKERAVLLDRGAEVADVEAEPVAVRRDLVLGVDRGDRVLEVDDRGDGGLGQHVLDPGRVGPADRPGPVDDELEVQAVVAQQHARRGAGVAGVPGERGRIGQPGGAGRGRGGEAVRGDASSRSRPGATRRRGAPPGRGWPAPSRSPAGRGPGCRPPPWWRRRSRGSRRCRRTRRRAIPSARWRR